jgi:hypothetical protein
MTKLVIHVFPYSGMDYLKKRDIFTFSVPKGVDGVRPVFDYSAQTPCAKHPPFVLPNLYQVLMNF